MRCSCWFGHALICACKISKHIDFNFFTTFYTLRKTNSDKQKHIIYSFVSEVVVRTRLISLLLILAASMTLVIWLLMLQLLLVVAFVFLLRNSVIVWTIELHLIMSIASPILIALVSLVRGAQAVARICHMVGDCSAVVASHVVVGKPDLVVTFEALADDLFAQLSRLAGATPIELQD